MPGPSPRMIVTFERTAERRYRVRVEREDAPALIMDPAPGYDASMPHDLLHFVVEAELRIANGIFGQLAQGGDAGTFHAAGPAAGKWKRKGRRLAREGKADAMASERLVHEAGTAWRKRTRVRGELVPVLERLAAVAARWRKVQVGGSLSLAWE
jgi:hypothetical protein